MDSFEEYKKLLKEFVSFKSVSTDQAYLGEIEKTVSWLNNLLFKNGFKAKILKGTSANPVVFGSLLVNKSLPTILIYGHYDVQPANKQDGWKDEPFELRENKSKIFARGVVDNKGQILIHISNVINLFRSSDLKYNVKFLVEGNEETGNDDLAKLMKKYKKEMACDIVLVSDGELTNNKPTIEISLRGGFNSTLTFTTGKNNLHSGIAGGAVPNAAVELSKFISKIYEDDGSISFKKFYEGIDFIDKSQLENNQKLQKESKNLASLLGVKKLLLPKNIDFFTQTGLSSTIQVSGIKSGYIESGYSNIVPAVAEVRLNFRLASSQKPEKIIKMFKEFVKSNIPKYVDFDIKFEGLHSPIKVNTTNKYVKLAEKILESVYKTKVNRRNVGGAIPFVADVKAILGVDTLLIPLVNEDCNMHGANENFDIELAKKGLEFSKRFLTNRAT